MKANEFLKNLERSSNPLFSLSDLLKILGKDENYAKVFLNRIVKRKMLIKIGKGRYALPNQNPFSIASTIIFPSYISFISAYSFYGLTTQIPRTIFVLSLKQKKGIAYNDYKIEFVKIAKERFFGYKRDFFENKIVFIAEVEKAVLDSLFLPRYCPIPETFFTLKGMEINMEKLLSYLKKFNSAIVAKRLGYLLDLTGVDIYDEVKPLLNKNYDLLNPLKPKTKEKNKKWKIIVNEVLE